MDIINYIIITLTIIPLIWVISDLKKGKIKNIFIFPYFLFLIILTFFIKDFYNYINLIQLFIIFFLGYIFYIYNKWWAGDWKYIIILWLSIIIIWYLKWLPNLSLFFLSATFFIISIWIIFYMIYNIKDIIKKTRFKFDFKVLDIVTIFSIVFITSSILQIFYNTIYNYLILFLLLLVIISIYYKLKIIDYFKYFITFFWLMFMIYFGFYLWYVFWIIIYFIFTFFSKIIDQSLDNIDIETKKVFELKQWDILTQDTINKIRSDIKIDLYLSPLQWNEVFEIIGYYKEKNDNFEITTYKDIKIWIYIYIWYIITIIYFLLIK